jgi:hypothetical protein
VSSDISIIVPTITGREEWLVKCLKGYKLTAPDAEVIVVKDAPSCAEGWEDGAEQASGKYLHFTADDIIPAYDWWQAPIEMLDKGIVPVANVYEDGRRFLCETPMGLKVMIPFLTRAMLKIGGWFLPIHDGSDDWITYRAWRLGLPIQFCPSYVIHHYIAPEGRRPERRARDLTTLEEAMAAEGHVPHYYRWLADRNRRRPVA